MMDYKRLASALKASAKDDMYVTDKGLLKEAANAIDELSEIKQAEAEGRLIVLGGIVYQTDGIRIYESKVTNIYCETPWFDFSKEAIGKTVFTSREAAEEALKEVQQG